MSTKLIVSDTHPKRDFNGILQLGLKAFGLATTYATVLKPRLPEGTLDNLSDDLEAVGVVVPGARQARNEAMSATAAQEEALEKGYAKAREIRAAVRKTKASNDVRRAYGVGYRVNVRLVRDVKASIQQIVDRATKDPAEAIALGILAADVDILKAALENISGADLTQEKKRANAPLSTKERNRTVNRIVAAVGRIEGAGRIQFANEPETLASFQALGAGVKKKKSKKDEGKKGAEAPKAPAEALRAPGEAQKAPAEAQKAPGEAPKAAGKAQKAAGESSQAG